MSEKVEEVKPVDKAKKCIEEVQKLLENYNCVILSSPRWQWRDDGTYSMIVVTQIVPRQPKP